jgi:hypothetical protein
MHNVDAAASGLSVRRREIKIVGLLSVLAAVHVFVFSAAFPFFNNVDEPAQFDLVLQYSHGQLPHGLVNTSREASVYLALFCSCAFLGPSAGPLPPPPWTLSEDQMRRDLAINSAGWQTQEDYEVSEPPLYYALAGIWWDVGEALGFNGERLLYWLRFLNIVQIGALVWLAYLAARTVFPDNLFLRIGVPAFIAFIPQSAFYSIGNDIFSALFFGATFICLVKWFSSENPSAKLGAITGLAFAGTFLSKMTNVPLLAIASIAVLIKMILSAQQGKLRSALPAFAAFIACSVPLILSWMLWCQFHFGDLTGSKLKMDHFGWTIKPFAEWWHHPIYTPLGIWTYLTGQLSTFWQGEFEWFYPPSARPLELPGTGFIYTVLSLALVLLALPGLFSRTNPLLAQRRALQLSLTCFIAALGFFGLMSTVYDFHNCVNPSREHPYFHAGRMVIGMLIPFLLLLVYGLDRILNRLGNFARYSILIMMVLTMLVVELITDWPAFSNAYNWFHLP